MSEDVLALLKAGKLIEAEVLCTESCHRNAGDAECQALLAYIKVQLQKYTEAITHAQQAVNLAPENPNAPRVLAYALHAVSRFHEAIECYQGLLQRNPRDAQVLNNLGNSFLALDQLEEAMECYRRAVNCIPRFPDALNNMGTALRRLGRYEDAIGKYQEALKVNPDYFLAYSNIGDTLLETGNTDGAIENYRKSLHINPGHIAALQRLANALATQGDNEAALEHYRRIVDMNPNNPDAWFSMGVINGKLDRHDREMRCYQKAVEYDPDFTQAFTNLGAMLNTLGRYDQALEQLNKALEIKPDNILALLNTANAWRSKEQFEKAAAFYERVLALQPNHAEADYQLSILRDEAAPNQPPEEYVAALFDQYAWNFDDHLTKALKYQTPTLINQALRKVLPIGSDKLAVLDAGCGTGLCGVLVKDVADKLVGIDLSSGMLGKAKERGIYDDLHVANMTDFMRQSSTAYDVIIAADVLPYLGALDDMFVSCSGAIRAGGIFIFTTEMHEGDQHFLRRSTGRYSHALEYILGLAENTGFSKVGVSKHIIRTEKDDPVFGHLIVLKSRGKQVW